MELLCKLERAWELPSAIESPETVKHWCLKDQAALRMRPKFRLVTILFCDRRKCSLDLQPWSRERSSYVYHHFVFSVSHSFTSSKSPLMRKVFFFQWNWQQLRNDLWHLLENLESCVSSGTILNIVILKICRYKRDDQIPDVLQLRFHFCGKKLNKIVLDNVTTFTFKTSTPHNFTKIYLWNKMWHSVIFLCFHACRGTGQSIEREIWREWGFTREKRFKLTAHRLMWYHFKYNDTAERLKSCRNFQDEKSVFDVI